MKESRSAKKPTTASKDEAKTSALRTDLDLPVDGGIRLELPGFEGPLDLLLHLIQEHELDILNIPIAFITKKYLEYIQLMEELNIDIASEYLVMAATLAHIKSRSLLPTPPADQEEGEEEELDPRAELIRRLLEYQKYKKAGEELATRSVLGRDVFVRGALPATDPTTAPLAPVSSFKLLEAFQRVLSRAKIVIDHQIEFERFSLSDRINQLVDLLKDRGRVLFEDLFEGQRSRADLVVTFLALLELTRLRMTRLYQDHSLEPIYVELAVVDENGNAVPAPPPPAESTSVSPNPDQTPATVPPAAESNEAESNEAEDDSDEDDSDEDDSDEDDADEDEDEDDSDEDEDEDDS
ncbi:MAG: segregation and condensation protein A, partial [Myxococcales bacterium]